MADGAPFLESPTLPPSQAAIDPDLARIIIALAEANADRDYDARFRTPETEA